LYSVVYQDFKTNSFDISFFERWLNWESRWKENYSTRYYCVCVVCLPDFIPSNLFFTSR